MTTGLNNESTVQQARPTRTRAIASLVDPPRRAMDVMPTPSESMMQTPAQRFSAARIHLVGIGGCGMLGAARMLMRWGAQVSGSDMNDFAGAGGLVASGAKVSIGHRSGLVDDGMSLVVRSAAVPDTNPEIASAMSLGIPVISYPELLGEITKTCRGIAIAGAHGKSTTTAMTAHVMRHAGLDPTFVFGAESKQLGGNCGVGEGMHFVVEACEYARSFLRLQPHSAAILNVDADHLDCYRDIEDITETFGEFASRIAPDGLLVVNQIDRRAKRAARLAACRVETFGFTPGSDWRATNLRAHRGCYTFTLVRHGRRLASCRMAIAGKHNVLNALACAALATHAGAEPERIAEALSTYEGVHRRMTLRGNGRGVTIIDDYAHHPTEIRATLAAIRNRFAPKHAWVVFQPHQASRTRILMDDFVTAFADADTVIIPDIYTVRDSADAIAGVSAPELVSRICRAGRGAMYASSLTNACDHLEKHVREGDVVVTMGAGDVWKVADELVERIC